MNNAAASNVTPLQKKFHPWMQEAEILSGLIQNKSKLTTFIDEINPDFFNSQNCKIIFKNIKFYFEKYSSSPSKAIMSSSSQKLISDGKIQDAKGLLDMIETVYERKPLDDHEVQYFHDEVLKFIKQGKIRDVILEGISNIDDPDSFDEIQEKLKNAVLWKIDENLGIDLINVKERYLRQKEMFDSYIPSPWPSLNSTIGGGFYPKTLNCFAAASSVGKSIALDQVSFFSWKEQKKNVLSITLELSEEMKSMRLDSHFTGKIFGELLHKQKEVEEAYSLIDTNGKRFVLKEFAAGTLSPRKLNAFIERLDMYSGFKPELIVVDYLSLMTPSSGKRGALYEDLGEIAESLRGIGTHWNCPVVSAVQLNRASIDLAPMNVNEIHVADSQRILNTVDNLIGIIATPAMRAVGQASMKIFKSRMGQKDKLIDMKVDYQTFTFIDA